jgi:hypothetical protein
MPLTLTDLSVATSLQQLTSSSAGRKSARHSPHKEGTGFNIELKAFPIDDRLVALPPDTEDNNSRNGK